MTMFLQLRDRRTARALGVGRRDFTALPGALQAAGSAARTG
jgi:hypothetical protein